MCKLDFQRILPRVVLTSITVFGVLLLSGCGALLKTVRYGELKTTTELRESIFLEVRTDLPPTVYLSEVSTVGRGINVRPHLQQYLARAGYTVVDDPYDATYVLQMNHVKLAEVELRDGETVADVVNGAVAAGYAGALGAIVLGADDDRSVATAALVVGLTAGMLDAATKHIAHTLTTDLLITETVVDSEGNTELRYHETRIVSGASKVNLELENSLPVLERQIGALLWSLLRRPDRGDLAS